MFNWLKALFFGKAAKVVEAPTTISNKVFEKEAILSSEAPYIEPVAEQPKPKKKRYYRPKAKNTETTPRNRKGP